MTVIDLVRAEGKGRIPGPDSDGGHEEWKWTAPPPPSAKTVDGPKVSFRAVVVEPLARLTRRDQV